MVLKVEPIYKAVRAISYKQYAIGKNKKSLQPKAYSLKQRIILFSAKGKTFTQQDARRLSKYDQLIFICGRYEGVDARVAKILKAEKISVGPYVLTGGELPAAIVIDAVARQIEGVLGKFESVEEERIALVVVRAHGLGIAVDHRDAVSLRHEFPDRLDAAPVELD